MAAAITDFETGITSVNATDDHSIETSTEVGSRSENYDIDKSAVARAKPLGVVKGGETGIGAGEKTVPGGTGSRDSLLSTTRCSARSSKSRGCEEEVPGAGSRPELEPGRTGGAVSKSVSPDNLLEYFRQEGKFPCLFSYMPQFWTVGVEHPTVSPEPVAVSLYMKQYSYKWTVIVSYPGSKEPLGNQSITVFLDRAKDFNDVGCQVFPISGDTYSYIRKFRNGCEDPERTDTQTVTFLTDTARQHIGKMFGIVSVRKKDGEPFFYPGYFIFTPDRELVQYCIIRDSDKLFERNDHAYFCYPFTKEVVENILQTIKDLQPMYDSVRILRLTFPRANFGSFITNMIYRVQTEELEEDMAAEAKESIFTWKGWGESLLGAFKGGLH